LAEHSVADVLTIALAEFAHQEHDGSGNKHAVHSGSTFLTQGIKRAVPSQRSSREGRALTEREKVAVREAAESVDESTTAVGSSMRS
jgi:hypothetical protein